MMKEVQIIPFKFAMSMDNYLNYIKTIYLSLIIKKRIINTPLF